MKSRSKRGQKQIQKFSSTIIMMTNKDIEEDHGRGRGHRQQQQRPDSKPQPPQPQHPFEPSFSLPSGFVFGQQLRILFQYLERVDRQALELAKGVLKDCERIHLEDSSKFDTLTDAINERVRLAVGEHHWDRACEIQRRLVINKLKHSNNTSSNNNSSESMMGSSTPENSIISIPNKNHPEYYHSHNMNRNHHHHPQYYQYHHQHQHANNTIKDKRRENRFHRCTRRRSQSSSPSSECSSRSSSLSSLGMRGSDERTMVIN